jgi:YfiR/HmsC-like
MSVGRIRRWRTLAILAAIATLALPPAPTQQRDEREVRVAYLYSLIKFVDWPSPRNDLLIGYVGSQATGETLLKSLDGRKSDARTLQVVLSPNNEMLEKCEIIYFGDASPEEIRKTLTKVNGLPVLTVGETDSFPRRGGMIGLVKDEDHIEIIINLQLAQRSGVKISSRVLNLATIVRSGGEA